MATPNKKPAKSAKESKSSSSSKIVKHSTGSFRAFDIMPPGKVSPQATSRPIITSTKSAQEDNTLTTAPLVHKSKIVVPPSADAASTATKIEVSKPADTTAPEILAPTVPELLNKPAKEKEAEVPAEAETPVPAEPETETETPKEPVAITVHDSIPDSTPSGPEPEAPAKPETPPTPEPESEPAPTFKSDPLLTPDLPGEDMAPAVEEKDTAVDLDLGPGAYGQYPLEDDQESRQSRPMRHSDAFAKALREMDKQGRPTDNRKEKEKEKERKPVVVVHKKNYLRSFMLWFLWLILCVAISVAIVDVLLDAGIVHTVYDIPYTDFIKGK